jgi:hypothetical protein
MYPTGTAAEMAAGALEARVLMATLATDAEAEALWVSEELARDLRLRAVRLVGMSGV